MRPSIAALLALSTGAALTACGDEFPTSPDPDRLPIDPVTVEVLLPFSSFASGAEVLSGFGSPADLGVPLVARAFDGTLDIRTLTRFRPFPTSAQVRNPAGVTVTDSTLTFVGGRIVAFADTLDPPDVPLTVRAGLTTVPWDASSSTWQLAVDSGGVQAAWPVPGGGPVVDLGTDVLEPPSDDDGDDGDDGDGGDGEDEAAVPDSVVFELDSAQVARLGDVDDPTRGVRLSLETPGERFTFARIDLRLTTRPSVHPDTLITLTRASQNLTFIFDPPPPPPEGLRVGGAPAYRSVLTLDLPEELDGPAELCEAVGCPVRLEPGQVNAAFLVLRGREVPVAFRPVDTLAMDLRAVLAPELGAKSPLGPFLGSQGGEPVAPSLFADPPGTVSLPLTGYVRDLIRGETRTGGIVSSTLALLAVDPTTFVEPAAFGFASFVGPGDPGAPLLRLILTFGGEVEHP